MQLLDSGNKYNKPVMLASGTQPPEEETSTVAFTKKFSDHLQVNFQTFTNQDHIKADHFVTLVIKNMSSNVPRVKLGSQGLVVSAQGLGCMSMSSFYRAAKPEADMIKLIHHAVESGVTFLDTSDKYGPYTNEILIGKALKLEDNELKFQIVLKLVITGLMESGGAELGIGIVSYSPIRRASLALGPNWLKIGRSAIQGRFTQALRMWITINIFERCRDGNKERRQAVNCIGWVHQSREVMWRLLHCRLGKTLSTIDLEQKLLSLSASIDGLFNVLLGAMKGCTGAQLALAWVHHEGSDLVPILNNFNQNTGALYAASWKGDLGHWEFGNWNVVKFDAFDEFKLICVLSGVVNIGLWLDEIPHLN
ncbi:probable aldo-keto reductase 2 [Tanacetum coccineum]|uniref:Probable aldo-keto reductase 2 n=1 Tax=Tanacetum coccineum TaxID=301880 RepID=A0ABQ5CDX6_9ASTR